jgi:hypothetical protein
LPAADGVCESGGAGRCTGDRLPELEYAKALAEAVLDASKAAALEKFPRWKKLQPLDPARVNSDGTVRGA